MYLHRRRWWGQALALGIHPWLPCDDNLSTLKRYIRYIDKLVAPVLRLLTVSSLFDHSFRVYLFTLVELTR